MEGLGKI